VRSITRKALTSVKIPRRIHVAGSTKTQPKMRLDVEKMRRVFVNIIQDAVDAINQEVAHSQSQASKPMANYR
jgi:nitrogen fixation/metabolism regulation signal transduction histidine kinase